MALFDLTDLAAYLQQDIDTASATLARTMATGLIVNYTNQNIESATYTHKLPIDGNATIRLPQRPVTAITSVTVAGVTLTADTDWDWDGITALVVLDGYTPDDEDWQATVVYTAGYATVPADVKAVALDLAAQFYTRTPGVASESIDDYRVQYSAADVGLAERHKQILRKYKMRLGSVTPTASVPTRSAAAGVPTTLVNWLGQA